MSETTQTEYAAAKGPTSVWVARPRHIEGTEDVDSITERIRSGRSFLKVVVYPWGVEFDVCDAEEGP